MEFAFLDGEHQALFQELREKLAEFRRFDKEYLSVVYLMAGCPEFQKKAAKYFDGQEGGFFSEEMFKEQDFSSGIHAIAKLAVHLFNGNKDVLPLELIASTDARLFKLAINALILRRYGLSRQYRVLDE